MSTIDSVDRHKVCPCGNGKIRITECSPDHPYARKSQTWYTAEIMCNECIKKYQIDDARIDGERYLVLKSNNQEDPILKIATIDMLCEGLNR